MNDALLQDAEASLESTRRGIDDEWYSGQVQAYYRVLATALRNQAAETEDPALRAKIESWAGRADAAASAAPGTRLDVTLLTEISSELVDACPPGGPITMASLNASNLQPFDPTRTP